jgi:hypothetical protein
MSALCPAPQDLYSYLCPASAPSTLDKLREEKENQSETEHWQCYLQHFDQTRVTTSLQFLEKFKTLVNKTKKATRQICSHVSLNDGDTF